MTAKQKDNCLVIHNKEETSTIITITHVTNSETLTTMSRWCIRQHMASIHVHCMRYVVKTREHVTKT